MKAFIKKYLISGVLVLVPIVATVWVLKTLIIWLDGLVFSFFPYQLRPKSLFGYDIPGLGFVLTIVIILLAGAFARMYIGKKFVAMGDSIFARVPFGRAIYQATKQVLQSTLTDKKSKERRVVLVEFPIKGTYAMGFLTGHWNGSKMGDKGKDGIMVFVPTAPNPTSGFLLVVSEDSLIPTNLSAEEASKLLISGGLLARKSEVEVTEETR